MSEENKSFGSSLFDKASKVFDKAEDKISKLKDQALDYIPEINIDYIETSLNNIGYTIPRVEIAITIPPRIAFEIDLDKSVVDQIAKNKILEQDIHENQEDISNRVLVKIIEGLDSAIKLRDKLKFKNKHLSRVSVEGSMIPTIKLIYLTPEELLLEQGKDTLLN
jgi:hypothetical protein